MTRGQDALDDKHNESDEIEKQVNTFSLCTSSVTVIPVTTVNLSHTEVNLSNRH